MILGFSTPISVHLHIALKEPISQMEDFINPWELIWACRKSNPQIFWAPWNEKWRKKARLFGAVQVLSSITKVRIHPSFRSILLKSPPLETVACPSSFHRTRQSWWAEMGPLARNEIWLTSHWSFGWQPNIEWCTEKAYPFDLQIAGPKWPKCKQLPGYSLFNAGHCLIARSKRGIIFERPTYTDFRPCRCQPTSF